MPNDVFRAGDAVLVFGVDDGASPEGAAADAVVSAYDLTNVVGRLTDVTVSVATDVRAFFELGRRYPTHLRPGPCACPGPPHARTSTARCCGCCSATARSSPPSAANFVQPTLNIVTTLRDPARPDNMTRRDDLRRAVRLLDLLHPGGGLRHGADLVQGAADRVRGDVRRGMAAIAGERRGRRRGPARGERDGMHEVDDPARRAAAGRAGVAPTPPELVVVLRPLTVGRLALISRAARDDAGLVPLLMIKESLVDPPLTLDRIRDMHIGLVHHLVSRINRISGLTADGELIDETLDSAAGGMHVLLARHFGWTPEQVAAVHPGTGRRLPRGHRTRARPRGRRSMTALDDLARKAARPLAIGERLLRVPRAAPPLPAWPDPQAQLETLLAAGSERGARPPPTLRPRGREADRPWRAGGQAPRSPMSALRRRAPSASPHNRRRGGESAARSRAGRAIVAYAGGESAARAGGAIVAPADAGGESARSRSARSPCRRARWRTLCGAASRRRVRRAVACRWRDRRAGVRGWRVCPGVAPTTPPGRCTPAASPRSGRAPGSDVAPSAGGESAVRPRAGGAIVAGRRVRSGIARRRSPARCTPAASPPRGCAPIARSRRRTRVTSRRGRRSASPLRGRAPSARSPAPSTTSREPCAAGAGPRAIGDAGRVRGATPAASSPHRRAHAATPSPTAEPPASRPRPVRIAPARRSEDPAPEAWLPLGRLALGSVDFAGARRRGRRRARARGGARAPRGRLRRADGAAGRGPRARVPAAVRHRRAGALTCRSSSRASNSPT